MQLIDITFFHFRECEKSFPKRMLHLVVTFLRGRELNAMFELASFLIDNKPIGPFKKCICYARKEKTEKNQRKLKENNNISRIKKNIFQLIMLKRKCFSSWYSLKVMTQACHRGVDTVHKFRYNFSSTIIYIKKRILE